MARPLDFNAILGEVRDDDPDIAARRSALVNPLAGASPPLVADSRRAAGAVEKWDRAVEWIADVAGAFSPAAMPSEDVGAISRELNLDAGLTAKELALARRTFMWANHPDRRGDIPRDLATRRVAIANMLIDRARRAVRERGD